MNAITTRAQGTMFSFLETSRVLNLQIEIQLHLFDSMVTPILLFDYEAWVNEDIGMVEELCIRHFKYDLKH